MLIKVTSVNHVDIWINREFVVSLTPCMQPDDPAGAANTTISTSNGETFNVKGAMDDIALSF